MVEQTDQRNYLAAIESLKNELHLKQLQINRLLSITQAINNNVRAVGLYEMYSSFLGWELGIRKMALYVREEELWHCTAHIDVPEELRTLDICHYLPQFVRLTNLDEQVHPLLRLFDIVIPVRHKDLPIAYVFIGGFREEEEMYNKIQLITTITNIISVAIENKRLFKRQLEQERLRKEMELAAEVQRMLIPKSMPINSRYEFKSIYKPQLSVGGDYFDFLEFEDGKIVFCIGDFTGKGLAAALLMSNFQANFHTLIAQRLDLDIFIREMNKAVNRITNGERFITFFIAEYDVYKRRLKYVNAGHNPPLVISGNQKDLLNKGCIMLGIYPEIPEVEIGYCTITDKEAIILTYTDGLTDIKNAEGHYFTEELLSEFASDHYRQPAARFNEQLMDHIDEFRGQETIPDDFTVLTCKVYCPEGMDV
ncbi:MAG: PP2C family protein-serine/threonine phosphatase [Haliscomenobacter sp.]